MPPRGRTVSNIPSQITITGARHNNLQSVDVAIPRGSLTVVTGLSGSGKSSLAIDTLYAEGQRRYMEGVSAYARRFLERLPRPDVDFIEGISPAVALDQRAGSANARSTVGTSTEIQDYLRLFFARVGRLFCDTCDIEVPYWTIAEVARSVVSSSIPDHRILVQFPMASGKHPKKTAAGLRRRGYLRYVAGGEVRDFEESTPSGNTWMVLGDRVRASNRGRLVEALEAAFREGDGRARVQPLGGDPTDFCLGRSCSRCGQAYPEPVPQHFSFNSPLGACPPCRGFGHTLEFDLAKIVPDPNRTLAEGAIAPWAGRWRGHFQKRLEASPSVRTIPRETPWRDLDPDSQKLLIHGEKSFRGVIPFLRKLESKSYKAGARFLVKRYQSPELCQACEGSRLRREGLRVRVGGDTLPEWCALPVHLVGEKLAALDLTSSEQETVGSLIEDLSRRLGVLDRVGLGYLTLDRQTRTLSGGESQRIELAQSLGAGLVSALYILDEPTVGLHPRDTGRLLAVLESLRAQGNTVVVVEHDLEMIRASDWIVDLGPGAGRDGGSVVYCGPTREREAGPPSPTLDLLREGGSVPTLPPRDPQGWIQIRDASLNNLKNLDVQLPRGVLAGVCGVSGSGKSSLVSDTLVPLLNALGRSGASPGGRSDYLQGEVTVPGLGRLKLDAALKDYRLVDQSPIGRSARSIPASYVGAWSGIRTLFARQPDALRRKLGPGMFSFNLKGGRCELCRGEGEVTVDMDFMADVRFTCEACSGKRFSPDLEDVRYRRHNISDVLALTVDEAIVLFTGSPKVVGPLRWMERVGLGYLTLGQPAASLSGGEAQRLKLVRELAGRTTGSLILLDEPTVGLHGLEVRKLIQLLHLLVEAGNSVLVVEHQVDVLSACDWLLELGPEGGDAGGHIVASGPPAVVRSNSASGIAQYLIGIDSPQNATNQNATQKKEARANASL